MKLDLERRQRFVCQRFGAAFFQSAATLNCGVSRSVGTSLYPINGLRYAPESGTTGWFVYSGESYSSAPDFYYSVCTKHLMDREPLLSRYLGLAPGWRFLIAPDYEDVWFDANLLKEDTPDEIAKGFQK